MKLSNIWENIVEWIVNNYNWIVDAFENWDMELDDFKEQLVFMVDKTLEIITIIINKLRSIIKDIMEILAEILNGLRGWR